MRQCGVKNGKNVEKSLIPLDPMKYKREQAGKKYLFNFIDKIIIINIITIIIVMN